MSELIRSMPLSDESVLLVTPKTAAVAPVSASALEEWSSSIDQRSPGLGPEASGVIEPSGGTEAAPAEPVALEPRYTYTEFMQQFEPELVKLREEALQEGLTQGQAEGRERAAAQYQARLANLADLIASARQSLDRGIDGIADLSVEIVYEAVVKVIGAQMIEREAVIAAVREVIYKAKERSRLIARVAPHDFELINGDRSKLIEGLNVGEVEIVADDRVRMGGCLLETPAGNLDGRLEIQMGQLRDALLRARALQE